MKKLNTILFCFTLVILFFTGCRENEKDNGLETEYEIYFFPTVEEMETTARASGNDFFAEDDPIEISITSTSATGSAFGGTYTYRYNSDGTFRGDPENYRFPVDDYHIAELTAQWPPDEWISDDNNQVLTDQRELKNHRRADWLKATAVLKGIMPTQAPVPLEFEHLNCMLEFQLTGQTSTSLEIESLVLELEHNGKQTAFWAYCGGDNGHAELILAAGTRIHVNSNNRMIGRAQVKNQQGALVSYSILMQQTDLTLEEGHKYLVTLSGTGYDLTASFVIGGWNQGENGIGIPFQQPSTGGNGIYLINTPAQLITASYLIRNYSEATTIEWPAMTYVLTDNFTFNADYIQHWVPIPQQLPNGGSFSGKFLQNGVEVQNFICSNGGVETSLSIYK